MDCLLTLLPFPYTYGPITSAPPHNPTAYDLSCDSDRIYERGADSQEPIYLAKRHFRSSLLKVVSFINKYTDQNIFLKKINFLAETIKKGGQSL